MNPKKICKVKGCERPIIARNMCNTHYRRFIKTGSTFLDPHGRKGLVYGVGINNALYPVIPAADDKRIICPYYDVWSSMLQRCYSPILHKKRPTYIGCEVADEWKTFMNFRQWMMFQDWRGKQLDKDIIEHGNKIYSSEKCAFVTRHVNTLLCDNNKRRGAYPIGVNLYKPTGQLLSSYCVKGKKIHIGLYGTIEEASNAYISKKSEYVLKIANEQNDYRVRDGLINFVTELKKGLSS